MVHVVGGNNISPTNLPQAGQYRLDPNSCLQVSVVGLEKGQTNPSLIGTALIRLFHTVEVLAKLQHDLIQQIWHEPSTG